MEVDTKIIFLDVDGVLNSEAFYNALLFEENVDCFAEDIIDPHAVALLKKLIRETEAKVILSSSWRWDVRAMESLLPQLNKVGVFLAGTTIDDIRMNTSRAKEIKLWLDEHPEVEHYVVLDDTVMDIPEIARHHIKTNIAHGLQANHIEQAKNILNGDLI